MNIHLNLYENDVFVKQYVVSGKLKEKVCHEIMMVELTVPGHGELIVPLDGRYMDIVKSSGSKDLTIEEVLSLVTLIRPIRVTTLPSIEKETSKLILLPAYNHSELSKCVIYSLWSDILDKGEAAVDTLEQSTCDMVVEKGLILDILLLTLHSRGVCRIAVCNSLMMILKQSESNVSLCCNITSTKKLLELLIVANLDCCSISKKLNKALDELIVE